MLGWKAQKFIDTRSLPVKRLSPAAMVPSLRSMPRTSSRRTSSSPFVSDTPLTTAPCSESVACSGSATNACVFAGNGAIAQEIAGADVGRAAVEIVGVHRGEGAVDGAGGGKHGGNGAAGNLRPDRLVGEHDLQTWPMPRRDLLDARRSAPRG